MAQPNNVPSNNDNNDYDISTTATATPCGPNKNYLKHKYSNFVKKVKISAQKAKSEAKRKRIQQKTINSYKHNTQIIENHQNRRNYTLSTETLQDSTDSINNSEIDEKHNNINNENINIMNDNWTCIVIQTKSIKQKSCPSLPIQAPPPIPHSRRSEIEENIKHKRSLSDSVHNLFNQIGKKKKKNSNSNSIENINDNIEVKLDENKGLINDNNNDINNGNNMKKTDENILQWQWCDDSGKWHNYGLNTCKEIESFYNNEMNKYEYDVFGRIYVISFKEMKQYNNLNQTWNVRRNDT